MIDDFISLIYPSLCCACERPLFKFEHMICAHCSEDLPFTNYHLHEDSPILQLFLGKVCVNAATSYLFFNKGDKVQRIMHELKYKSMPDVGIEMGKRLGNCLTASGIFCTQDIILPVPLHPSKKRSRGYNQSDMIAQGISASMNIPCDFSLLKRDRRGDSQTRKSVIDRWKNVNNIFSISAPHELKNKRILLVDDVITTGSTLTACIESMKEIEGLQISVATLACA